MSRRIALVIVGLVAALLLLAVVPLGFSLTANERASFGFATRSAGDQVAAQAEEYLADHDPPAAMYRALADAANRGDCATVYGKRMQIVAATPCGQASDTESAALARLVLGGAEQAGTRDADWQLVASPIGDDGKVSGVAVLARSSDPMNDRIAVVWTWLAGSGLVVLLLGILFALRLGRWVARPLTVLGASAARFGDGALETRAAIGTGPNEVRELSQAFNRMAERIQSLIGSHRAWVADVSHQLRTPLTALRLRVDILAAEAQGETAAEMTGLQAELTRLGSLVDGLLAVARAEATVPRPEAVRADETAADRVAAWEPVARERGVALRLAAARPAAVRLGPGDLEQMLDNLIANALDSVPEGGAVSISVETAGQSTEVRVADDGPGMSEQAREDAFRRFGRSGTGGNGLGLAIVHRLAGANGAEIALRETPGGGLTVALRLPVSP
ncbi:MAG TPA: HAMP domain-containing sensor histidine kinase [Actinospica sp.]|nr:HAMP domain-containing sensor histidine kinase [Actinospica sp.]